MRVVTFYSYKGGVGRTLACANYGMYLAKTGQKVVLADMDFEAPGLDSKFPTVDISETTTGMLDHFVTFQNGEPPQEIDALPIPLADEVERTGGSLRLVPAGNYLASDYFKKLSGLRWEAFVREEGGLAFCLDLVKRIEKTCEADTLIIDSRTGLTEVGGLCTQVLPDTVILFTCASRESIAGTRRIHDRIINSPIVKSRLGGRTDVELRIVVARTPRPENLPEFDQAMKKRLDMSVDQLYYLFDQRDLSVEEYLALDRFTEERPAILDDYIELFASFEPEFTMPYIEQRVTDFSSGITRRSPRENDRLIQELVTLFPHPEVILEAARYYRNARDGDAHALANYVRYLDLRNEDREALAEFAEVCAIVDLEKLKPTNKVTSLLRAFGAGQMDADLLSKYFDLAGDEETVREIAEAIQQDDVKLASAKFRTVYVNALVELREWGRVLEILSAEETHSPSLVFAAVQAHIGCGNIKHVHDIIGSSPKHSMELLPFLYAIHRVLPNADLETVEGFIPRTLHDMLVEVLPLSRGALRMALTSGLFPGYPRMFSGERKSFDEWTSRLQQEHKQRTEEPIPQDDAPF